ncbi:MAG: transcriptional regulator [Chloroflexi bacterium]|nr:transcriptional regulator [Chloroflexota bacterium]
MARISSEEIQALLKQGPGENLVLQPARTSPLSLATSLAALANTHGGTLILGVDAGLPDPDEARLRVLEATLLCDPPLILPVPESVTTGDKLLLVQGVPPGLPHVYHVRGKYLYRQGTEELPLPPERLRQLLLERSERGFELLPVADASWEDLDSNRIYRYLESRRSSGEVLAVPQSGSQDLTDKTTREILQAQGCLARDHRPTWAGILLFGKHPQRFLPSAEIIAVRYAGTHMSDTYIREDIRDTLPEQIRRAEAFVVSNMRVGARLAGLARDEQEEYPREVIREAIVNAVAHRDYGIRGDEIRVTLYADRLEIYSPGRLPGHVTLANLKDERFSRNPGIVQILADLGFIERLGYGIDRMLSTMKARGLPEPKFEETANGFRVIISGQGSRLLPGTPQHGRWTGQGLNERQQLALAHLQAHERITNSEYQDLCPGVSAETLRRDLSDLVDKNMLLRIGEKRATYYILK